jgi:hypothetical protein
VHKGIRKGQSPLGPRPLLELPNLAERSYCPGSGPSISLPWLVAAGQKKRSVHRPRPWPGFPAPSFRIVALQHPSRQLVPKGLEELAEVHLVVHPRPDARDARVPTRPVRFLGDPFEQFLG